MTGWASRRPRSSRSNRYLARELGPREIRANLISAGPISSPAASGISGFEHLADGWDGAAPLGWDTSDPGPVAGAVCFLLSDAARGISGELIHVDGGAHAVAPAPFGDRAGNGAVSSAVLSDS